AARSVLLTLRRPPSFPLFPYTTLFRSQAVSVPPVKATPSHSAWATSAAPTPAPSPGSRCRTSAGTPAAWNNFTASEAMIGVCSRSEEQTSELQSRENLVCRLLLEKKKH